MSAESSRGSTEQGLLLELGAPQTDGTCGNDITDNSDRSVMWERSWLKYFIPSIYLKVNGSQEPQPATLGKGPSTIKLSLTFVLMIRLWFLTPLTPTTMYFAKDTQRKDTVSIDLLSLFDQLLVFTCVLHAVMLLEAERQKCRLRNLIKPDYNLPLFVGQLPAYKADQDWLYSQSWFGFMGFFFYICQRKVGNDFGEIWEDLTFYCVTIVFFGFAQLRLLDLYLEFRINKDAVQEFISANKISVEDLTRQKQKSGWHLSNFPIIIMWAFSAIVYIILICTNPSMNSKLDFQSWTLKKFFRRFAGGVQSTAISYTFMLIVMFVDFTGGIVLLSSLYKREYDINRLQGAVRNKNNSKALGLPMY